MTVPEPLTGDLFERCRIALTHTRDGLAELDRQRARAQEEDERRRKQEASEKLVTLVHSWLSRHTFRCHCQ